MSKEVALIVGAGAGLSASLARLFAREGMTVALAARNTKKLSALVSDIGGRAYQCDTGDAAQVMHLFAQLAEDTGDPDLVVFNASARSRGPVADLDADEVHRAWLVGCYGGFLVAQQAARPMLRKGSGTILFTGASASVKGYAQSAPFAMIKFGLRGLAQSMARELAPRNVHVAHIVIDGGIASSVTKQEQEQEPDRWLDPDAIAVNYLHLHRQHRSAWTWEVELRPWTEKF